MEVLHEMVRQQIARTGQRVIDTTEVGDHQMWAGQYLELQAGWQFIPASGQGAMGSGLPMASGAPLAPPDALVVCLAGDGRRRLAEAELETIWADNLPVQVLVVNNEGYGMVRLGKQRFYQGREPRVINRHKAWTRLAQGNGCAPELVDRVTAPAKLEGVWARAPAPWRSAVPHGHAARGRRAGGWGDAAAAWGEKRGFMFPIRPQCAGLILHDHGMQDKCVKHWSGNLQRLRVREIPCVFGPLRAE
jgi:Thiamine pyrophosphate enzyme, C-terminal TPP binding domain